MQAAPQSRKRVARALQRGGWPWVSRGRCRRGVNLIELVVVMTVVSLLLPLIAMALQHIWQADRHLQRRIEQILAVQRLADQMREDARQARAVQLLAEDTGELIWHLEGGVTVHYTADGREIHRLRRQQQETIHRESYPLPRGTAVQWETFAVGTRTAVQLTLSPENAPASPSLATPLRLLAVVEGALWRASSAAEEQ